MKFILWTLTWFGMLTISDLVAYGFPTDPYMRTIYSDGTIGGAAFLALIIWLVVGISLELKD